MKKLTLSLCAAVAMEVITPNVVSTASEGDTVNVADTVSVAARATVKGIAGIDSGPGITVVIAATATTAQVIVVMKASGFRPQLLSPEQS